MQNQDNIFRTFTVTSERVARLCKPSINWFRDRINKHKLFYDSIVGITYTFNTLPIQLYHHSDSIGRSSGGHAVHINLVLYPLPHQVKWF